MATQRKKSRRVTSRSGKATRRTRGAKAQNGKGAADLETLCRSVENAQSLVDGAKKEAEKLQAQARKVVTQAKTAYREVLIPYRGACRKAGVKCEFTGGRAPNVSERVSYVVEKADKGLRVMVIGRPETEEIIPKAKLKVSIGKCAEHYCERWLGERQVIGNKAGGLGNRLRAVLKK